MRANLCEAMGGALRVAHHFVVTTVRSNSSIPRASLEDGRLMFRELEVVANGRYCAVLVEFSAGV
jgi:hypothetical protein